MKVFYRLLRVLLLCTCLSFCGYTQGINPLVHPGLSHKKSDLDRMKNMVQAGLDPWKTSFQNFSANQYANYNYTVRGNASITTLVENNATVGYNYELFKYDALAAYYNSLMWYITGDERHAKKSIEIFNAWSNLTRIVSNGTKALDAGRVIWKMLEGAEIIKNTYTGWNQTDIDKFKAMLVYPGYSTTVEPTAAINSQDATFYWYMYNGDYGRHGNQGIFAMRGIMAMGVFLDNRVMYERALKYLKGEPHRSEDLPYPSGPTITTTSPSNTSNEYYNEFSLVSPYIQNTITDYGYNELIQNYIWENGQCQESSRDQGHAVSGVSNILTMCEMAWNQGEDLYSFLDNRPLLGLEFGMRYNASLNYSFPDQTSPWEPTVESGEFIRRKDRSGRWESLKVNPWNAGNLTDLTRGESFKSNSSPIHEMALGHYRDRVGLSAEKYKWTKRAFDISLQEYGYEGQGFQVDHPGWGGLTFRRPNLCAGDPCQFVDGKPSFIMNNFPGVLEAENFDYFVGDGQNKSYYDLSSTNTGGQYRNSEPVDIANNNEGGYRLTSLEDGEWLNYTVNIPNTGRYQLDLRYAALLAGGKIKIEFNGIDKTGEVTIPLGESTGSQDWKTLTLSPSFTLNAGVQSMRVKILGTSSTFEINSFSLSYLGALPAQTINFPSMAVKTVGNSDFSPNATTSSGLAVTYTSSNTAVATIVNNQVHIVGAGTTLITASQSGNDDYSAATNVSKTLAVTNIAAGDYVSTGTMNWNGGTWNIANGNGGYSGTTTNVPTATTNVHILSGHTVTLATTAGLCKNLTVYAGATLTESIALTVSNILIMNGTMTHSAAITTNSDVVIGGTWTASNNLTSSKNIIINTGGTYKGTTTAGGSVVSLTFNGDVLQVDGTLGSTITKTTGESIRLYTGGTGTKTITGTGKVNIARFQPVNNAPAQQIVFDIDVNFGNNTTATSGVNTFSLLSGSAAKTLTINAGKTVSLTHANASFHSPTNATETNTNTALALGGTGNFGDMTYNIYGTLDASLSSFVLYSNTNANSPTPTQTLTVNVKNGGTLKLGANVRMAKNITTQSIKVNVEDGGIIDGSTVALNLTTVPISANGHTSNGTGSLWFTLAPNATYKQLASSNVATPLWIEPSNTSYNPIAITPTTGTVFAVALQKGNVPTGLLVPSKAINLTWTITPTVASPTNLQFTYNDDQGNVDFTPSADIQLMNYNSGTSAWETITPFVSPITVSASSKNVSFTGVNKFGAFTLSNDFILPQNITFNTLANKTIGDTDFDAGATSSSGLLVSYNSSDTLVAKIVANKIHVVGAGTTTITASQAGNNLYSVANSVSQSLTVSKLSQSITFNTLANKTIGDTDFDPGATTNSGLLVSYSSSDTLVAKIVANKIHIVGAGVTTITASQAGSNSYNLAPDVSQTLTVISVLKVKYQDGDNNLSNNQIKPNLTIINEGSVAVPYSELTVRYWFTAENFKGINTWIDYAQLGNSKVKMKYIALPNPRTGAFGYIEYSFETSAGNLLANSNSGVIQSRFANTDWSNLSESDDYSRISASTYTLNNHITLYRNGQLIYGLEPTVVPSDLKIKVYTQSKSSANTNTISTYLKINNEGNIPVNYTDLKVRYWFTKEGTAALNYYLDYALLGNSNIQGQFTTLSPVKEGADNYLEILVKPSVGILYPSSSTGNIQYRIAKTDWSSFNQANDYSYLSNTEMILNEKLSVYYQGQLIAGTEPSVIPNARIAATIEEPSLMLEASMIGNPITDDKGTVEIRGTQGFVTTISLINMSGSEVLSQTLEHPNNNERFTFTTDKLSNGIYLLRITSGNNVCVLKVLK
ncbi:cellulose binding domain-containing protein [Arcicella sp. DC2W]|uniref:Cellulose binding domain-containing protein n=1 Tax=Arcicella gelida TaxID=2984195 RepID=A0ABU5S2X7_9BACT|nr:cellulose binding domain-containing protein [Arcicella sp. DC2W]MEA5402759.1 cellulose binding domain-containing protein [Arcicella sp. DC2W]